MCKQRDNVIAGVDALRRFAAGFRRMPHDETTKSQACGVLLKNCQDILNARRAEQYRTHLFGMSGADVETVLAAIVEAWETITLRLRRCAMRGDPRIVSEAYSGAFEKVSSLERAYADMVIELGKGL